MRHTAHILSFLILSPEDLTMKVSQTTTTTNFTFHNHSSTMTVATTSTLSAASQSLAHLLNGTKQRPTNIRRTRQKRRQKLAEVDAARSAEEERRRVEEAVRTLKKSGKIKSKELEVREQVSWPATLGRHGARHRTKG
ncbi:hypothetical protein EX30DRAFT_85022 [Ascodesmis nigricans]|uniref:Uncharacterized protein n=1 Tax=Ascodesmis nigricans TaxID=341454 RepID=A0A4S2N2V8_9PEZI|nr:hypothetical protein EX30DRAFT_85022 [Ascodesmis nigricans]